VRERFARAVEAQRNGVATMLRSSGARLIEISTAGDYLQALLPLFASRRRRS
jgi:hypothetical protein